MNFLGISMNTLNKDLQKLNEIKDNLKKVEEIDDLMHSYDMVNTVLELCNNQSLEEINIKANYKKLEKYKNKLLSKQITRYIENDFLLELASNFFNNYYEYYFNKSKVLKQRTLKEVKQKVLSFYGEIGTLEYDVAKTIFAEKRIDTLDTNIYNGFSIYSILLKTGYIFLNNDIRVNDDLIIILTHEIAHIIEANLQSKYNTIYSISNINFLTEIISTIYELQCAKYLGNEISNYTSSRQINSALLNFTDILLYYRMNYKIRNSSLESFNETDKLDMFNPILYSFPVYLSLKLLDNNINIKDIKISINYMIKQNYNLTYEEIVKIFNLDLNDFISGKINNNNMKKYLKK